MSELMLDVDQASELKAAFRRGDWTNAEIKSLSEGDTLKQVRSVVRKYAEIKMFEHLIDCDATPFVPGGGWSVLPDNEQLPNRVRGTLNWGQAKVKLHLVEDQKGNKCIVGNKLREALKAERVLPASVLDWLLKPKNQCFIPEECKKTYTFFWGTIYRISDGSLCVRYLYWGGGWWDWSYYWLDFDWDTDAPAALLAS